MTGRKTKREIRYHSIRKLYGYKYLVYMTTEEFSWSTKYCQEVHDVEHWSSTEAWALRLRLGELSAEHWVLEPRLGLGRARQLAHKVRKTLMTCASKAWYTCDDFLFPMDTVSALVHVTRVSTSERLTICESFTCKSTFIFTFIYLSGLTNQHLVL